MLGVMTVLVVDVIHVQVEKLVLAINTRYVDAIVMVMTPFITADFVTSFIAAIHLRDYWSKKSALQRKCRSLSKRRQSWKRLLEELARRQRSRSAESCASCI